ncbi:MAG: hypothetical protein U0031_23815 [Thermomicrobiales bacterium]
MSCLLAVTAIILTLVISPDTAAQESTNASKYHSLDVNLDFPDDGLANGEQLCVALYQGANPDLSGLPLLSRCLDPGNAAVTFDGLPSGDYSVLMPGPGSKTAEPRYQGQLVSTNIPADDTPEAYGIDVSVALAPEFAGTTGQVRISVFGCPAGTDAGANRDSWVAECQALAGGVPMTLTGTGSIEDAAFRAVTGVEGDSSGRVEFSNLPPGAYEIGSDLPQNVTNNPALFVESSIDGSVDSLSPDQTLAIRPSETVAVDVFLVLNQDESAKDATVGATAPEITGGVSESEYPNLILIN